MRVLRGNQTLADFGLLSVDIPKLFHCRDWEIAYNYSSLSVIRPYDNPTRPVTLGPLSFS